MQRLSPTFIDINFFGVNIIDEHVEPEKELSILSSVFNFVFVWIKDDSIYFDIF